MEHGLIPTDDYCYGCPCLEIGPREEGHCKLFGEDIGWYGEGRLRKCKEVNPQITFTGLKEVHP